MPAKHTKRAIGFAFAAMVYLLAASLANCDEPKEKPSQAEIVAHLDKLMADFEASTQRFPDSKRDEGDYEYVQSCKKSMRAILDVAGETGESDLVFDRLCEYLCHSEVFRGGDYYAIWLGSRLLIPGGAMEKSVVNSLIRTIDNRAKASLPKDVETELVSMTLEVIFAKVQYDRKIIAAGKPAPNWDEWEKFKRAWAMQRHKAERDDEKRLVIRAAK